MLNSTFISIIEEGLKKINESKDEPEKVFNLGFLTGYLASAGLTEEQDKKLSQYIVSILNNIFNKK